MSFLPNFGRLRHPNAPAIPEEVAQPEAVASELGHGAVQVTVAPTESAEVPEKQPPVIHVAEAPEIAADPAHIPELRPAFSQPIEEATESFKAAQAGHNNPEAELSEESLGKLLSIEKEAEKRPDTGAKLLKDMLKFEDEYDPVIRPYVLGVAIKHGGALDAIQNLSELSQMGALTNESASGLISQGYSYDVGRYIDQFPQGSEKLAHELIAAGQGNVVLSKYKHFPGLRFNAALAEKFIEAGSASLIIDDIERGKIRGLELNEGLTRKLLETQNAEVVVGLIKQGKVSGHRMDSEFARVLVDTGNADVAIVHAPELGKLPASAATKAIEQGYGELVLFSDNFTDLQYDKELFDTFVTYAKRPKRYMELASRFGVDGPGALDEVTAAKLMTRDPELVGKELFRFRSLDGHTKGHLMSQLGYPVEAYPASQDRISQDAWYARNSYSYLDGPWPQAKIGQVMRQRLELGLETDLHDVSQWMDEFQIPQTAPDIDYIKSHRLEQDFDAESIPELRLIDEAKELDLLHTICAAPSELRQRFNFSAKPENIVRLFSKPEHQLLFTTLMSQDPEGRLLLKDPNLGIDKLLAAARGQLSSFYEQYQGSVGKRNTLQNNFRLTEDQLRSSFELFASGASLLELREPSGSKASELIAELKTYGINRQRYAEDAADWLSRHAAAPSSRLKKVWKDRAIALVEGVDTAEDGTRFSVFDDSAKSIERWQVDHALPPTADALEVSGRLAELGLTKEELLSDEWKETRYELGRVLSAHNVITAIAQMKESKEKRTSDNKWLPPTTLSIVPGEASPADSLKRGGAVSLRSWTFESLANDDPRGYTIGEDTGCCMTINGQAKSCIRAGYDHENAGFIVMYDPAERVAGQSFWYINPDQPDTLVLDNIETNQGRDMGNILAIYKQSLTKLLLEADNPAAKAIRYVNVGEGFTKVSLDDLDSVAAVPPINETIYTDAKRQRRLLEIEREQ